MYEYGETHHMHLLISIKNNTAATRKAKQRCVYMVQCALYILVPAIPRQGEIGLEFVGHCEEKGKRKVKFKQDIGVLN